MKIVAQSQIPTKVSYIHLAYISAQLGNRISKGEIFPVQAVLTAALAAAVACGVLGARLKRAGRLKSAATPVTVATLAAIIGFIAVTGALIMVERVWGDLRTNDEVVAHVIKTHQWWALREPFIAAGVEDAASTNREAVILAVRYYGLQGRIARQKAPELLVKGYIYAEAAAAQGYKHWDVYVGDLTNEGTLGELSESFKAALDQGKLSPVQQSWAKQRLDQMLLKMKPLEHEELKK